MNCRFDDKIKKKTELRLEDKWISREIFYLFVYWMVNEMTVRKFKYNCNFKLFEENLRNM